MNHRILFGGHATRIARARLVFFCYKKFAKLKVTQLGAWPLFQQLSSAVGMDFTSHRKKICRVLSVQIKFKPRVCDTLQHIGAKVRIRPHWGHVGVVFAIICEGERRQSPFLPHMTNWNTALGRRTGDIPGRNFQVSPLSPVPSSSPASGMFQRPARPLSAVQICLYGLGEREGVGWRGEGAELLKRVQLHRP